MQERTERPHLPFTQFPLMETSCKIGACITSRILILIELSSRTFLSPGGSLLLPVYSGTHFLPAPLTPLLLICSPFLQFSRVVHKWNRAFGIVFFTQHDSPSLLHVSIVHFLWLSSFCCVGILYYIH